MSESRTTLVAATFGLAAAGATAGWVALKARRAEKAHPPTGRILDVQGTRLHVVERGSGPAIVLLHGNNATQADFNASGLIDTLARRHRVIAFDRPGYGHSSRPRNRLWTPRAQAAVLRAAVGQLGVTQPIVVGHSMGALVALAWALDAGSELSGVVVLGGYFYPAFRLDALLTAPVALPVVGDALRYTVTALSARALLRTALKGMFAPNPVPVGYLATVSREMLLRPSQLRANAEDAAFMMPAARAMHPHYGSLLLPVAIVAGVDDLVVDPNAHAVRLNGELAQSRLTLLPNVGHMVHHGAPVEVAALIEAMH